MRLQRVLISISLLGLIAVGLVYTLKTRTDGSPVPPLAGLHMIPVASGHYDLTILVPDSFGRTYHSKPVTIAQPFHISQHEITIDQWNSCYAGGGCPEEAKQRPYQTGNHPVTRISWYDAMLFTQWLSAKTGDSYRLPTEEEWAFAAMAGKDFTRQTIDGLIEQRQMIQTASMSRFRQTLPVGSNGQNDWAIADMTGSVWEWTLTCWFSSDEENQRPWSIAQLSDPDLCPNRIVQGDERAHVPFFIDKVYTGGCGTGSPVDHIGFRVVRGEDTLSTPG
ncbi:MAG: SUMF1/EgtB/PvdO family nonheme iron enzyme [Rhodospirillales bacterium]|nr:SUMF1/EgtB/PvdO family nonheme iron enzyme [Rhodospirillales bacterium]